MNRQVSHISQTLNRYAYVKNNPLKYTDPDGHSWLSKAWKKVKGWIGTIATVGLSILLPGVGGMLAASILGSAIGTRVNGGTFKSFAIGVGIGFAAGVIAGGFFGGAEKFATWADKGIMNAFAAGAVTGAIAGGISSAIYGGNWGNNMLQGAIGGLIGAGIGMATRAAINKLITTVKGMSATREIIREVPGGGVQEDQIGDTCLAVDGSIITPGNIEGSEVDNYIDWLKRVSEDKSFDISAADPVDVLETAGTAGLEYYFLGAINITNLSLNVMNLGYSYLANRLGAKVADGLIYLRIKGWQQLYRGWVKVQPMEYRRGGFLWLNKGWYKNGNAYWKEAKGGRGYDQFLGGYTNTKDAARGIERLQGKIWDSQ